MFKKFILWLVRSSENPSQISLTLRGTLLAVIPPIVLISGLFPHMTLDTANLTAAANSFVDIVVGLLTMIGSGMAFYGFIRKIINTIAIPWPTEPAVIDKVGEPTQLG